MFISKRTVRKVIMEIYDSKEQQVGDSKETCLCKWEVQSALNLLCDKLKIKPKRLS
jgi:hypothetical protein